MVIDTHAHLDGEEFAADLPQVVDRARKAGVAKVFLPAIHETSVETVLSVCRQFPDYAYPMVGLHPEEVTADWEHQLRRIHDRYLSQGRGDFIAIGEVGLDYYWSREFEREQLLAFEEQVKWAIDLRLPLMIHCRKALGEMVAVLRRYADNLPGGVFHCFTGNQKEAGELLRFPGFVLGIGGVCTFKSSHLREDLPAAVPLDRLVLETDSPYMAPVPYRGKRNESAFVIEVLRVLATSYGVSEEELALRTNENVARVFGKEFLMNNGRGGASVGEE